MRATTWTGAWHGRRGSRPKAPTSSPCHQAVMATTNSPRAAARPFRWLNGLGPDPGKSTPHARRADPPLALPPQPPARSPQLQGRSPQLQVFVSYRRPSQPRVPDRSLQLRRECGGNAATGTTLRIVEVLAAGTPIPAFGLVAHGCPRPRRSSPGNGVRCARVGGSPGYCSQGAHENPGAGLMPAGPRSCEGGNATRNRGDRGTG